MQGREQHPDIGAHESRGIPWHRTAAWLNSAAWLVSMALVAGCGSRISAPPQPSGLVAPAAVVKAYEANSPVNPALIAADDVFGLKLLDAILPGTSGNVAIAPISIAMALQIVYNGAAGPSAQALAQTLQLGSLNAADINSANAALEASLINPDPKVQITVANSLWMHLAANPVSNAFIQTDTNYYGASIGDLSGAPGNVNDWVATETHGLITKILGPEPPGYYQQIIGIVANVIYFKGAWTGAFDPRLTQPAPFTRGDGTQVTSNMMSQTASFGYYEGADFQAVRMPYGAGRLSMLVVLPAAGLDITEFVTSISGATLDAWVANLQPAMVAVGLPRFTATWGASLTSELTGLGMGNAYCTSPTADLSGIAPNACISDVDHATSIEVDEAGTIASGATSVGVSISAVAAPQFTMTMNRPFFYAIRDDETGELLFVGVLEDPTAT